MAKRGEPMKTDKFRENVDERKVRRNCFCIRLVVPAARRLKTGNGQRLKKGKGRGKFREMHEMEDGRLEMVND